MAGHHRAPATLTDRIADWVDAAVAVLTRDVTPQPPTVGGRLTIGVHADKTPAAIDPSDNPEEKR